MNRSSSERSLSSRAALTSTQIQLEKLIRSSGRKIPLSAVVSLMIAAMCVATALISFVPTYMNAQSTTNDIIAKLRNTLSEDVTNRLAEYFSTPLSTVRSLEALSNQSMLVPWNLTTEQSLQLFVGILQSDPSRSLMDSYLWIPKRNIAITMIRDSVDLDLFYASLLNNSRLVSYAMMPIPGSLHNELALNYSYKTFDTPMIGSLLYHAPSFQIGLRKLNPSYRWTSRPTAAYNSMHIAVYVNFIDDLGNEGAYGSNIVPTATSAMLKGLNLGPSARALVIHNTSGIVVGNNWNQSVQELNMKVTANNSDGTPFYQWQNLLLEDAQRMKFFKVNEMSDPLIAQVLSIYGRNFWSSSAMPFSRSFGTGIDQVLVDVLQYSDEFGLDMRTIIVQPMKDHIAGMYTTRNAVIGSVCAAVVLLIVLSGFLGYMVTWPLRILGSRMLTQANLSDEDEHELPVLSYISEVAVAQESYLIMRGELQRAKSYLPQSLVQHYASDEESLQRRSPTPESASEKSFNRVASSPRLPKSNVFNTNVHLSRKTVAVAAFNGINWHSKIAAMQPADCLKFQEEYITTVAKAVAKECGVVDFFQGDHLVATFNAVTVLFACSRRATAAALTAVQAMKGMLGQPSLCVGIAEGLAVCGNSGIDKMRRFNVMGPVYTEALALVQMARRIRRPILISGLALHEVRENFVLEAVDRPAASSATVGSPGQEETLVQPVRGELEARGMQTTNAQPGANGRSGAAVVYAVLSTARNDDDLLTYSSSVFV